MAELLALVWRQALTGHDVLALFHCTAASMTDFTMLSLSRNTQLAALGLSAGTPDALPATTRLLSRPLRQQLVTFNRFVRLADSIADDQQLSHEAKLARLDALERALEDGQLRHGFLQPALDLRHSLRRCGIQDRMARDMLEAFRRDVQGVHCQNWSDMLAYCRQSGAPIGRMLLALHGESGGAALEASDALCAACAPSACCRIAGRLGHAWPLLSAPALVPGYALQARTAGGAEMRCQDAAFVRPQPGCG